MFPAIMVFVIKYEIMWCSNTAAVKKVSAAFIESCVAILMVQKEKKHQKVVGGQNVSC